MIGQTVSHYNIIEKIGQGGMGVVYKAEDLKLGRTVALKFLKTEALDDPEASQRFLREARAAAALEHANVCAVYDIDQDDGRTFLAMSFVEGESIREKVARRPLQLDEALDYAIQTAQGLQAAHAKGIVHRDIKSANLMVTREGQVKIMDFGLAQLADQSRLTKTATFLGTPAYMSPEQVERKATDARTDLWSLGVVLYEMIRGRLPFEGETEHGVLFGIVNSEPEPLTAVRAGLPVELDRIVGKAMAKAAAERYQHADELLVDLRALRNSLQVRFSKAPAAERAAGGRRSSRLWPAVAMAAVGIAFLTGWLLRPAPEAPSPSVAAAPTPLTSYPGLETAPTFSPEGDRVAFSWEGANRDNFEIYVRLIGEDTLLPLTNHPAADLSPAWSPDGRRIAFVRHDDSNETSTVIVVPSIGGPERVLFTGPLIQSNPYYWQAANSRHLAWHPDGVHLVVSLREKSGSPTELNLLNADTGETRRLVAAASANGDLDPAVSPDGRRLAFRRSSPNSFTVHVVNLNEALEVSGEPRNLSGAMFSLSPAWMPGGREILFASSTGAEENSLWRISAEGGPPQPIVHPPAGDVPAVSRTGNRGAFVRRTENFDIWQFELGAKEAQPLILSTYYDVTPMFSPDGGKIAFSSSRSGYSEIWLCDSDGSRPVQLTQLRSRHATAPSWSPDGSRIVFQSITENQREIFAVPSAGGRPQRLTENPSSDNHGTFSRDGRWIYFSSNRSGESRIWKIPAGGGEALPVTAGRGSYAIESLDGRTLYFSAGDSLWSMPVEGGSPTLVVAEGPASGNLQWTVARDGIYFIRETGTPTGLKFHNFRSGAVRHLLSWTVATHGGLSVSPDGKRMLFSAQMLSESDILLVDEFR